MKRFSSLLLAIVMLLGLTAGIGLSAYAETDSDGNLICDGYTYVLLDDGTVEITGYDGCPKSLTVPSELDGYTVTSLGYQAFYNQPELVSIELPDTLTIIGDYAFEFCTKLENILIPEGVTSIGEGAFYGCDALTEVNISENVANIGDDAFHYCKGLKNINVSPNNAVYSSENGVLFNKDKTTIIQYPSGNERSTYSIPNSVTTIAPRAFSYNDYLKSMDIPDGVTDMGYDAFFRCENLESVTIGKGISVISFRAFSGCSSLKDVTIPNGVSKIDAEAFSTCTSLTEIVLPETVTYIDGFAFAFCSDLESIKMPEGLTYLSGSAFENCSSLKSLVIPAGVKEMEFYQFSGCEKLESIYIMNKDMVFGESRWPLKNATIYGYKGSTAQAYAEKNGIKFVAIDEDVDDPEADNNEAGTPMKPNGDSADKKDPSKSPNTGSAKELYAFAAVVLAGGAAAFIKKKEQ